MVVKSFYDKFVDRDPCRLKEASSAVTFIGVTESGIERAASLPWLKLLTVRDHRGFQVAMIDHSELYDHRRSFRDNANVLMFWCWMTLASSSMDGISMEAMAMHFLDFHLNDALPSNLPRWLEEIERPFSIRYYFETGTGEASIVYFHEKWTAENAGEVDELDD